MDNNAAASLSLEENLAKSACDIREGQIAIAQAYLHTEIVDGYSVVMLQRHPYLDASGATVTFRAFPIGICRAEMVPATFTRDAARQWAKNYAQQNNLRFEDLTESQLEGKTGQTPQHFPGPRSSTEFT